MRYILHYTKPGDIVYDGFYFREELEIPVLIQGNRSEKETLEGILDLLAETCSSKRKTIRIAGDDKPIEIVKGRLI